jgi:antiviral helicase SLH1
VKVTRVFNWSSKVHGTTEPFWLWVEDTEQSTILQLWHLVFRRNADSLDVSFVIAVPNGQPPRSVCIRFVSDRWVGAEDKIPLLLDELVMPAPCMSHSQVLDLPYLPISSIQSPVVAAVFAGRLSNFNSIQTQVLWTLAHSNMNALICAPVGCGKSLLGQIVTWLVFNFDHTYGADDRKGSPYSKLLLVTGRSSSPPAEAGQSHSSPTSVLHQHQKMWW